MYPLVKILIQGDTVKKCLKTLDYECNEKTQTTVVK